jgi:L-fuculose-phosphate aldolase
MSSLDSSFVTEVVRQALKKCLSHDDNAGDNRSVDAARKIFASDEGRAVRNEIVRAGRKLWLREYVDGNGGNISYRISHDYVICTPTLCSKGDLRAKELAVVDFANRRLVGSCAHTSEILLHLEIYAAVPEARAVIHCHPPHATAYAITGAIPPGDVIPEQEVFVGPLALSPYETPGTKAFAETVLPYVRYHNTILLANHGVVCWSDTITHAEWLVEVVDAYCRTLILASQIGRPVRNIVPEKIADLLRIKQRLRLPDARLAPGHLEKFPPQAPAEPSPTPECFVTRPGCDHDPSNTEAFEALVERVVDEVVRFANEEVA